jgi:cation transport ATPase
MPLERVLRWTLVTIAVAGLTAGLSARTLGQSGLADVAWTLGTVPVVVGLAISIVRDFAAGRLGVDAIALLSMSAALVLGQPLAGAVVALMYSGGNVLEEIAISRAERDLRSHGRHHHSVRFPVRSCRSADQCFRLFGG